MHFVSRSCLCLVMLLLVGTAARAETVEVLTGNWAPFVAENLPQYGFTAEIVSSAFKAQGITPEYVFESWARISGLIKEGQAFATFPYLKTEDRMEFAIFSERIADSRNVFFYSKKHLQSFDFKDLAQASAMRVGGLRGFFYVDAFEKAGIEIDYTRSPQLSFKKLLHGRIDIFPSNELVGWEVIKKHFPDRVDEFAAAKKPISESGLYLMASKAFPESQRLVDVFNKGLAQIKENGVYQQILEKYGLSR